MSLKPLFGAAAVALLLATSSHAARADDDWRGPHVVFGFSAPAYYQPMPPPPPAYYYAPRPAYAPAYGYYAAPWHWHCHHHHHHDDDDD